MTEALLAVAVVFVMIAIGAYLDIAPALAPLPILRSWRIENPRGEGIEVYFTALQSPAQALKEHASMFGPEFGPEDLRVIELEDAVAAKRYEEVCGFAYVPPAVRGRE